MPFVAEPLQHGVAHDHQPLVRTVGLVEREQVHVRAERVDVRQTVRCPGDAVHDGEHAGTARAAGYIRDRIDVCDHVGGVRKGQQPRARSDQPFELGDVQPAAVRVDAPFAHRDAVSGEPAPRAAVGFVILVGDDHLVARLQEGAEGLRQHVGVL